MKTHIQMHKMYFCMFATGSNALKRPKIGFLARRRLTFFEVENRFNKKAPLVCSKSGTKGGLF